MFGFGVFFFLFLFLLGFGVDHVYGAVDEEPFSVYFIPHAVFVAQSDVASHDELADVGQSVGVAERKPSKSKCT